VASGDPRVYLLSRLDVRLVPLPGGSGGKGSAGGGLPGNATAGVKLAVQRVEGEEGPVRGVWRFTFNVTRPGVYRLFCFDTLCGGQRGMAVETLPEHKPKSVLPKKPEPECPESPGVHRERAPRPLPRPRPDRAPHAGQVTSHDGAEPARGHLRPRRLRQHHPLLRPLPTPQAPLPHRRPHPRVPGGAPLHGAPGVLYGPGGADPGVLGGVFQFARAGQYSLVGKIGAVPFTPPVAPR